MAKLRRTRRSNGGRTGAMPLVRYTSMASSSRSGSISDSGPGPALTTTALPLVCRRPPCSSCCCCCGRTAAFTLSCCGAPSWRWRAVLAAADGEAEMPEVRLLLLLIIRSLLSAPAPTPPTPTAAGFLLRAAAALYVASKRQKQQWIMVLSWTPTVQVFSLSFPVPFLFMEIIWVSSYRCNSRSVEPTHKNSL